MEITFLGAARTVTGSKFLVHGGGQRVPRSRQIFGWRRESRATGRAWTWPSSAAFSLVEPLFPSREGALPPSGP